LKVKKLTVYLPLFSVFHFFFFFRVSVSSTPAAEQKAEETAKRKTRERTGATMTMR